MAQFTVKVQIKNKDLKEICERTYAFREYTSMKKMELMKVIMDVEDAFYHMQNDQQKENWDQNAIEYFQKIRHRLLDVGNDIERLPQNLYYNGTPCETMTAGEWIARVINEVTETK